MSSIGGTDADKIWGEILLYIQENKPSLKKKGSIRSSSRKRPLTLKIWSTVSDLKSELYALLHVPNDKQRLFYRGKELKKNNAILQDCGITKDGETIFLIIDSGNKYSESSQSGGALLQIYGSLEVPKSLQRIVDRARRAIETGRAPKLALEGTGGTYFLADSSGRNIGCFKPRDEEPFTKYNIRGFQANERENIRMREGIKPGTAFIREAAAFLLDYDHFSSVPSTCLVESSHPTYSGGESIKKLGSFQEFIKFDDFVSDLSPSKFTIEQVQKIAILDIRLLNCDRNDANILVCKKWKHRSNSEEYELVPIDHGYCLPDKIEIFEWDWCWYNWPQIKQPLCQKAVDFISELNPKQNADFLRDKVTLDEECIENFRIGEMLLKIGMEEGLSLFDIANIVTRQNPDDPSILENVQRYAKELAFKAINQQSNNKFRKSKAVNLMNIYGFSQKNKLMAETIPPRKRNKRITKLEIGKESFKNKKLLKPELFAPKNAKTLLQHSSSLNGMSSSPIPITRVRKQSSTSSNEDSVIMSPKSPVGFWSSNFEEMEARAEQLDFTSWDDSDNSKSESEDDLLDTQFGLVTTTSAPVSSHHREVPVFEFNRAGNNNLNNLNNNNNDNNNNNNNNNARHPMALNRTASNTRRVFLDESAIESPSDNEDNNENDATNGMKSNCPSSSDHHHHHQNGNTVGAKGFDDNLEFMNGDEYTTHDDITDFESEVTSSSSDEESESSSSSDSEIEQEIITQNGVSSSSFCTKDVNNKNINNNQISNIDGRQRSATVPRKPHLGLDPPQGMIRVNSFGEFGREFGKTNHEVFTPTRRGIVGGNNTRKLKHFRQNSAEFTEYFFSFIELQLTETARKMKKQQEGFGLAVSY